MIVRTFDGLQSLTAPAPTWGGSSGSVDLYGHNETYAEIYRTQPNVRICVDFLARNIAQLAPQVFRRVSDTDRERLADHELARWFGKPNPTTGCYRLFENLMGDMGVYFNANWVKVRYRGADGRDAIGLVRIPANELKPEGTLLADHYCWTAPNGQKKDFPLSEIVYFNGYNPSNALMGLSPLETLRGILAEEAAATEHREGFWRHSARIDGIVTRPKEKARYTDAQLKSWREQWQDAYAGAKGSGKTVLLQDGETFVPQSFSARDSEYTVGGKLRREVVAAAYHIPQPMVGILEHATFSNIKEQHKHLYQDCLGPWLEMIQQEIERQLLVECEDQENVYVEFNIAAKMAGSFEEQAQALQIAVGKPYMKVNEARAIRNLPRDDDPASDQIAPQQGGPSDATAHPMPAADAPPRKALPPAEEQAAAIAPVLHATRVRQQARLAKHPAAEQWTVFALDLDRWNRELADDLAPLVGADTAARLAREANDATLETLRAREAA